MSRNEAQLKEVAGVGDHTAAFPSPTPVCLASGGKLVLILTAATVILLIRKADSLINPQFWAEDGAVFFLQQYEQGASVIFRPYAGYLHLVPRLIALLANLFIPYPFVPHAYNYLSLFLTLLVIASIYSPRFIINNKHLLSLAIVLAPHHTNEVFFNITNLQWILAILIVITLLQEPPHPKYGNVYYQVIADLTVIICCGLTGPFIIFLTPFFMWKWCKSRNTYNLIVALVVIGAASIQMLCLISNASLRLGERETHDALGGSARVIGQKLFGNFFLGVSIPYKINFLILCSLSALFISFILYLALHDSKRKSYAVFVFLSFSVSILLATFNKFKSDLLALAPPGNGPRYFYLPYVMMLWSLIVCMEQKRSWKGSVVKALLGMVLASSLTSGFRSKALVDYKWRVHSRLIGKEENLTIPINPLGWYIHILRKDQSNG